MPVTVEAGSLIGIIRGILTDLNSLSDEQLQALINKEAKFKYFDKTKPERKGKTPSITQEKIEEMVNFISKCKSIEEAQAYFEEQKLKVSELNGIAAHQEIRLSSKMTKADIIKILVERLLGARLRYESIQRT